MPNEPQAPLWLLAELTYACPLQCPYCSNPLNYAREREELDTATWLRVLEEARALGAAQLGLSGGEPATRRDLEQIVAHARKLGYYTNLITSGLGLDSQRVAQLCQAGVDHIQVSFQASTRELNDHLAGTEAFTHKLGIARAVKDNGLPMVLCFVLHRLNMQQIPDMLALAEHLGADYVELATTQYYGWALRNRAQLLPTAAQLQQAQVDVDTFRAHHQGRMKIYYVVPDYYEGRPKACMHGWGRLALNITPQGLALPCHAAQVLPNLDAPCVHEHTLAWIWRDSPLFNRYRGMDWMQEPCRSCPEREQDFGGCRCQAYLLTGDAAATDPVCSKSPQHDRVTQIIAAVEDTSPQPLIFRNVRNSRRLDSA